MSRKMNWKSWAILGLAVAVLVTSGTFVMASNMGFKINKQIYNQYNPLQNPKRLNWVSLPYSSPYTNMKTLCTALGTTSSKVTIFQLNNPVAGSGSSMTCNLSLTTALDAARGVRITSTEAGVTPPINAVLVGSSDETKALPTILGGFNVTLSPKKENWISVPYHTTWVKAEDVCVSLGIGAGSGAVIRINGDPASGTNTINHPCGNTSVSNFSIVVGEAVDVRKTSAGDIAGKLPPHF
jgi:hypothetical protein